MRPIHEDDDQWMSLSDCLQTRGDWLGEGRDVKGKEKYDQLQLVRVWQIENPFRFRQYRVTQAQVGVSNTSCNDMGVPNTSVSMSSHT